MDRSPHTLEIQFDPELEAHLLEEALAVERECCPFFRLDYDSGYRRLSVSVERAGQEAALDGIAHALTT